MAVQTCHHHHYQHHQLRHQSDLAVLHLAPAELTALDLEVLGEIQQQVEGHKLCKGHKEDLKFPNCSFSCFLIMAYAVKN